MKKMLAVLLCLLISTALSVSAEVPSAFADKMNLALDDANLSLDFDGDPEYSMLKDGYIQASFYGYAGDFLYEMYLIFPETVQSGTEISTESCMSSGDSESGVVLYISDQELDACSMATQYAAGAFPTGSSYQLTFDQVDRSEDAIRLSGTLEGTLVDVDNYFNALSTSRSLSGNFQFTLSMTGAVSNPDNGRQEPAASPTPLPQPNIPPTFLITPPDAHKI